MKVDSGAAVSAIPKKLSDALNLELIPADRNQMGAGNNKLNTVGKAEVSLCYSGRQCTDIIYVVDGLVTPLLGKPALSKLQVIHFVDEVKSKSDWTAQYPKLFSGLGEIGTDVKLDLREGVAPYCQAVPRQVAAARRKPMKDELERMVKLGVIKRVEGPTEWCSPSIVVPKKNNKIRLCVDFTKLNEAVKRSYHPLPATDELLAQLGDSRVFSKLDANSGYWQMKLAPESQPLTTFITPFGRYMCCRLPFGISIAPEIFSREMQRILEGVEGIVCQMDDILIHTKDEESHAEKVREVLDKLLKAGVTLNEEKCEFSKQKVTFLGHVIDAEGIHADPEKIKAIQEFPVPKKTKDLKRFFGMVNYLGKFLPKLADDSAQLRKLLKKEYKDNWTWNDQLNMEYQKMKESLSSAPVLAPFSLEAETWLSTDASSYGLGAAIFQKTEDGLKPIAFASRALTETEQRYAQIEKEALAICWAAEKFYYYLAGRKFHIETDHKPLISILSKMELYKLPIRVQRFKLRMMKFCYDISYTPGEKLVVADALSRAPVQIDEIHQELLEVAELVEDLPISAARKRELQYSTLNDATCQQLKLFIQTGWPSYANCPDFIKNYFTFKDELTVVQDLIFYNNRIFIPLLERNRVLTEVHTGHLGESKCLNRARELVWWPGMTTEIRQLVKTCSTCLEHRRTPREPMMSAPFPERPWWQVAMDLCSVEGRGDEYLVIMDYYSRYLVAEQLSDTTSTTICRVVNKVFTLFGIPNAIVSDNGPQFTSEQFKGLLKKWDIIHRTSAPKYAQSNGEAERGVQVFKRLIAKNSNIDQALLCYRDSPLQNGYSPAQLLMGRSLNSMGIMTDKVVDLRALKSYENVYRTKMAAAYNTRHKAQTRGTLLVGDSVKLRDPGGKPCAATVVAVSGREVALQREDGSLLRRNRAHVTDNIERQDTTNTQELGEREASLQQNLQVPTAAPMPMHSPTSDVQASQRKANHCGESHNLEGPRDVNASSNGVRNSARPADADTSGGNSKTIPIARPCAETNSQPVRVSRSGRTIRPVTRMNL